MAIIYVASKDFGDNSSTIHSVSAPTNTSGDFLVAYCFRRLLGDSNFWSAPGPEWALLASVDDTGGVDRRTAIFYKFASAGEPGSYAFAVNDASVGFTAIHAFRGVDPSTPFDVTYDASHHSSATDAPLTAHPAISTDTDNAVVVLLAGYTDADITSASAPATPTNVVIQSQTAITTAVANNRQGLMAMFTATASGTFTPSAWRHTTIGSGSDPTLYTLALRQEVVGTDVTASTGVIGLDLQGLEPIANIPITLSASAGVVAFTGYAPNPDIDSLFYETQFERATINGEPFSTRVRFM